MIETKARTAPRSAPSVRRTLLAAGLLCACLSAGASQLTIRGDLNDTVFAKGKEHSVWTGNAVLESEDTVIHADRIDLWGKDFVYADCQGNLQVVNRKRDIYLSCERISYDRDTKFLIALGNVYMEDRKNGIVVKGESLQYDDVRDETIVQIRVRIFGEKEELQCRAEFARYLREQELLVLSGMPYVLWKGDEYRAVQISITLDEGKVQNVRMVEGSGKITSTDRKDKKKEAPPSSGGAPPQSLGPEPEPPESTRPAAGGIEP